MKVLYIQPGLGIGGSKISLYQILNCAPSTQISHVALSPPPNLVYEMRIRNSVSKIHYLQLPTWQKYRRNSIKKKLKAPISNSIRILKLIPSIFKLVQIINNEKMDMIHTNNSMTPVGAIAAYITHKPHVWHIREPIGMDRQYPLILGDKISFFLIRKLSKVIICNSLYTSEPFNKYNIPVKVILNGLDLNDLSTAKDRGLLLRQSLGIDINECIIGMVGNLTTKLKEHGTFLDVAAKLFDKNKNLRFVVFGSSNDLDQTEYTRHLKKKAEDLGLIDHIIWADFISDNAAIMNCIDILIHPVEREGSGRVIMEAMAAGKPVIGVKAGGVQELIEEGKTGFLVAPNGVKEITEKVELLLKNEVIRKGIERNAIAYANAHFSDQASMNAILNIYHSLI